MRMTIKELELPLLSVLAQTSSLPDQAMLGTAAALILALSGTFLSGQTFFVVLLLLMKVILLKDVLLLNLFCVKVCVWVRASCPPGL